MCAPLFITKMVSAFADGFDKHCSGRTCVRMSLTRVGEWLWGNQACRACTFDSPGLATIGAYPGERRREKIYAIGIVLSLNSFVQKEYHSRTNPFIACEWARHEKRKYNPQGGSLFACVVTWGSLLSPATPGYRK